MPGVVKVILKDKKKKSWEDVSSLLLDLKQGDLPAFSEKWKAESLTMDDFVMAIHDKSTRHKMISTKLDDPNNLEGLMSIAIEHKKNRGAYIFWIVMGCIVGAMLVVGLAYFFLRRKRAGDAISTLPNA